MTRHEAKKKLAQAAPHVFGIGGILAIVVGIGALAGWPWAAIAAGAPPAGFYLAGEIRAFRGVQRQPLEEE